MDEVRPNVFPEGRPLAGQIGTFQPAFKEPVERIVVYVRGVFVHAVTAPDSTPANRAARCTPVVIVYEDEQISEERLMGDALSDNLAAEDYPKITSKALCPNT